MFHGMICTLMIGSVLPEPEPPKYWIEVELLQSDAAGTTLSMGCEKLSLDRALEPNGVAARIASSVFSLTAASQNGNQIAQFKLTGFHPVCKQGNLTRTEDWFELGPSGEFIQLVSLPDKNLAFIVRLHRVK